MDPVGVPEWKTWAAWRTVVLIWSGIVLAWCLVMLTAGLLVWLLLPSSGFGPDELDAHRSMEVTGVVPTVR